MGVKRADKRRLDGLREEVGVKRADKRRLDGLREGGWSEESG